MWRVFKRDISRILVNPVAVIVTIGIMILPSAYAWLNIIANWDPYSNTAEIPVAVANLDRGTTNELTGEINIGKQLTQKLRTNHQLGWNFVESRSSAINGVQSGKYYAAIIVDKHFSQQLVDMLLEGGEQPELQYYVNEKLNPVSPKITDTAATTLEDQINSTFVGVVTQTVAEKINVSTSRARQLVEGRHNEAITKIDKSIDDLATMREKLDAAHGKIADISTAAQNAKTTLRQTRTAVNSAAKTARESEKLAKKASASTSQFSASAYETLTGASSQLGVLGVQVGTNGANISRDLGNVSSDVSRVSGELAAVIAQSNATTDRLQSTLDSSGLPQNSALYKDLNNQISRLRTLTNNQSAALDTFNARTQSALTTANSAVTGLSGGVSSAAGSASHALNSAALGVNGPLGAGFVGTLDSTQNLAHSTSHALTQLSESLDQSQGVLDELRGVLDTTSDALTQTQKSLDRLSTRLNNARTDMAALDSSELAQALKGTTLNAKALGKFMNSPVEIMQKRVYPVENYGSSVAPFFTNVALWVGGFVLIAVMKIEVNRKKYTSAHAGQRSTALGLGLRGRTLKISHSSAQAASHGLHNSTQSTSHGSHAGNNSSGIRGNQAYMGRWLLFVSIGVFQGLVATVGDLLIGIQMKHPVAFVFAGMFASVVYVSLIYALAATFKHIGKALAVIIIVMQVPGSSGMYPIELMPPFFRRLEPWLPFTYGINAMREAIGGFYEDHYGKNLAFLLLVFAFAMVLGLVVRPYLLNLNALFDRRLAETDLLVGEKSHGSHSRFRLSSVVRNVMRHEEFGRDLRRRAMRFAAWYPGLVAWGIAAIVVIPLIFLVLLFTVEEKLVFLMLWLLSIVLIDFYLITLEYLREVYVRELGMSVLSPADLRTQVLERIAQRWSRSDSGSDSESDEDESESESESASVREEASK